MAERRKPTHQKKKRRAKRKESSFLRTALTLCFCVLAFVFSAFLWRFLHKSREVSLHPERRFGRRWATRRIV